MFANSDIASILRLAEAYRTYKGITLGTCSLRSANSGSLFKKLQNRTAGLTIDRRDRIAAWFSNHWPDDLTWPEDIPRPKKTPTLKDAS